MRCSTPCTSGRSSCAGAEAAAATAVPFVAPFSCCCCCRSLARVRRPGLPATGASNTSAPAALPSELVPGSTEAKAGSLKGRPGCLNTSWYPCRMPGTLSAGRIMRRPCTQAKGTYRSAGEQQAGSAGGRQRAGSRLGLAGPCGCGTGKHLENSLVDVGTKCKIAYGGLLMLSRCGSSRLCCLVGETAGWERRWGGRDAGRGGGKREGWTIDGRVKLKSGSALTPAAQGPRPLFQ